MVQLVEALDVVLLDVVYEVELLVVEVELLDVDVDPTEVDVVVVLVEGEM